MKKKRKEKKRKEKKRKEKKRKEKKRKEKKRKEKKRKEKKRKEKNIYTKDASSTDVSLRSNQCLKTSFVSISWSGAILFPSQDSHTVVLCAENFLEKQKFSR